VTAKPACFAMPWAQWPNIVTLRGVPVIGQRRNAQVRCWIRGQVVFGHSGDAAAVQVTHRRSRSAAQGARDANGCRLCVMVL
jgi:hypothetical protein